MKVSRRHVAALIGFAALGGVSVAGRSVRQAPPLPPPGEIIALSPDAALCESAVADASLLLDGKTDTAWFPGWTAWRYPTSVTVDLGARTQVTALSFWNETGETRVSISTGAPFSWTKAADGRLNVYRGWVTVPFSAQTRWLRLTVDSPSRLSELRVYGKRLEIPRPAPAPKPIARIRPTIGALLGVNAFIDDPRETIAAPANFVREYHSWAWDAGDGKPDARPGVAAFSPSFAAGGNAWFFDDYYADLKKRGVTVCPAIQGTVNWLGVMPGVDPNNRRPHPIGADSSDPKSYTAHASHLFQFAARYGRHKVDDSLLHLAPNQPRKSGLNLLSWLENGNELDKTWLGRECRMDPFDLAALCSADYDGHLGALGSAAGVRTADPSMKMAIAGLIGINLDYLKAMKHWSDYRRAGSFPADAINVHFYANDATVTGTDGPSKTGVSPESGHLREQLMQLVAWRDKNLPAVEVWLTEYGWDTHPSSPQRAPMIGARSAEQVQADWLARSLLAIAASGVDRAALYMLRDVDERDATQYSTSGIVTKKGEWKPKRAFRYLATIKKRLAGYRFVRDVDLGKPGPGKPELRAMLFSDGQKQMLALWRATSDGGVSPNVALPLPVKNAQLLRLDDADGTITPLTGARPTVDLDETPSFVLWSP